MSKKNRFRSNQDNEVAASPVDTDDEDFAMADVELALQEDEPPIVEQGPSLVVKEPTEEKQEEPIVQPIENKEESVMPTEVQHQKVEIANAPASAETQIVTPKRTAVTRFNELAQKYISLASQGLKTSAQQKEAVSVISDIVHLVTTSHDKAVFDACFSFMLKNRAIVLSPQTVVGQVSHYGDPGKITRIVQFYVTFSSLVESKLLKRRYTININHVKDAFNNKQLADWLTDKR